MYVYIKMKNNCEFDFRNVQKNIYIKNKKCRYFEVFHLVIFY